MFRKLIAFGVLSMALMMSGCASVPMASTSADAQAKAFTPVPDKAVLYIYRNETMGAAIKMPLLVDGVSVGDTAAHTYVRKELSPGQHTITSKTEKDSTLTIDMLAGRIYYVWQEVKMGMFSARSALHQVDAEQGQKGVGESKLIN
ncbi:MAG: hypothetical protein B7X39_16280 [Lysobacterales bacterium 14-68-21]|jgi:hypothetical protein|nr:MAG: hypothetical protein B7X45_14270 [Xanthomonadales bacterium 15-68-25]OZB64363.1 MAG: hypothetical protein B7X39_16280 [Xanthomonadales bacterium 14-68-21]